MWNINVNSCEIQKSAKLFAFHKCKCSSFRQRSVSAKDRSTRLKFATEHLNETEYFWNTVTFVNKKKLHLFKSNESQANERAKLSRKTNVEFQLLNLLVPEKCL